MSKEAAKVRAQTVKAKLAKLADQETGPRYGAVANEEPGWIYGWIPLMERGKPRPPGDIETDRQVFEKKQYDPVTGGRVEGGGKDRTEYVVGVADCEIWRVEVEVKKAQREGKLEACRADATWVEMQKCRSRRGAGFL